MLLISFFVFILGAVMGSFTNVLIDRVPRGESVWGGRSYCEHCKRKLEWFELIPVGSYLFLNGKCRTCHHKIPARIFGVEVLTGALFVTTYLVYLSQKGAFNPVLLFYIPIISILVAIFFIDIDLMIIPDSLLIALLLITAAMHILFSASSVFIYIIAALVACLFFLLLFIVTRSRGIGFGDVKFAFVIGFLLGYPNTIFALYGAFVIGAIVSLILIMAGKKKFHGGMIAFGPFLVIGIFIALYAAPEILRFFPYL